MSKITNEGLTLFGAAKKIALVLRALIRVNYGDWRKNFADTFSRFDAMPECQGLTDKADGRTERQSCYLQLT